MPTNADKLPRSYSPTQARPRSCSRKASNRRCADPTNDAEDDEEPPVANGCRDGLSDDRADAEDDAAAVSNNTNNNVDGTRTTSDTEVAADPIRGMENVDLEVEAAASCTSDGLVVVLRRARPSIPQQKLNTTSQTPGHANEIFASPWEMQPVLPRYPLQIPMPTQIAWNQGYPTYNFAPNIGYSLAYGPTTTTMTTNPTATATSIPPHTIPN